jgi:hypothetical protein
MPDAIEATDSKERNDQKEPRNSRLRTGLLVVGSALLGGIAVALWNRRSLADIQNEARNQSEDQAQKSIQVDEDAIY